MYTSSTETEAALRSQSFQNGSWDHMTTYHVLFGKQIKFQIRGWENTRKWGTNASWGSCELWCGGVLQLLSFKRWTWDQSERTGEMGNAGKVVIFPQALLRVMETMAQGRNIRISDLSLQYVGAKTGPFNFVLWFTMEALKKNWRGDLCPQQEHSRERCRKQK